MRVFDLVHGLLTRHVRETIEVFVEAQAAFQIVNRLSTGTRAPLQQGAPLNRPRSTRIVTSGGRLKAPTAADEAAGFRPKVIRLPRTKIAALNPTDMNVEMIVKLIEEIVDIKVQQQAETHLHVKPELAQFLEEKRHGDRRRLEMIKQQLARHFS